MKKLSLVLMLICIVLVTKLYSAPNTLVGIHLGDIEGMYIYFLSSNVPTTIISTGTTLSASYTDWAIQNYSTNTYNIYLSTTTNFRGWISNTNPGNYWILLPGDSLSPQGIFKNAPVFGITEPSAGSTKQRIQVIKTKFSN